MRWRVQSHDVAFAAACSWLLASFVDHNLSEFATGAYGSLVELYACIALMLLSGYLVAALCGYGSPARRASALTAVTVVTVTAFMVFAPLTSFLRRWIEVRGYASGASALTLVALGMVAWRLGRHPSFRAALALAMAVSLALGTGSILFKTLTRAPREAKLVTSPSQFSDDTSSSQASGANVYYIVADGYPRQDVLAELLGFDNSRFLEAMKHEGFYVAARSRSPYTSTYLTLMALLEGEYVVNEYSARYRDVGQFYPAALNAGKVPKALQAFRGLGYTTLQVDNYWGGCHNHVFDKCVVSTGLSYPVRAFLSPTPLPAILHALGAVWGGGPSALEVLRTLDVPRTRAFVFAHHMAPHPPYLFNADCSRRDPVAEDLTAQMQKQLFSEAVSCVNRMILGLVRQIVSREPSAIIVVQGDHGSPIHLDWDWPISRWSDDARRQRSAILNLVRMPKDCQAWLYPEIGNINTMRAVVACLQHRKPDFLLERSYLSLYEQSPDFGIVTPIDGVRR